jgi:hypothetical protein
MITMMCKKFKKRKIIMKKTFIFSLVLCVFSPSLFGMMTIVPKVATKKHMGLQLRIKHTNNSIHPHDYGIDPHCPYSSLESPQTTVCCIKKFLRDQSKKYRNSNDDIKKEAQKIASCLLHQAQMAKKMHQEMDDAVKKHNNSVFAMITKLKYAINNVRHARHVFLGMTEVPDGSIVIYGEQVSWLQAIKNIWKRYCHKKVIKKHRIGVIEKRMPIGGLAELDAYAVAYHVILNNKNQFDAFKSVSFLTHHFMNTEQKHLEQLQQVTKELEKFLLNAHKISGDKE